MRIQQICNLLVIYDRHRFRRALFKKYNSVVLSAIINILVALSILFFGVLFFFTFYYIFSSYDTFHNALLMCCKLSISCCTFLAIGKESDFLFKGNDFLLSLPVSKAERFIAIQLSIYKSEVLLSFFFFITLFISIPYFSVVNTVIILFFAFFSPIIGLPIAIIIGYIFSSFLNRRKMHGGFSDKDFKFRTFLIKCELHNLFQFPSLILELTFLLIFYSLVAIASVSDFRFLGLLLVYNSLGNINTTSFSREGRMYDFLKTLPLNRKTRYLPKIETYLMFALPLLFLCIFIVAIVTTSCEFLFYFIPLGFNLINITIIGLKKGGRSPKVDWVNIQDALQLNYSAIVSCLAVTMVTSFIVFFNPFSGNLFINTFLSSLINILLCINLCKFS